MSLKKCRILFVVCSFLFPACALLPKHNGPDVDICFQSDEHLGYVCVDKKGVSYPRPYIYDPRTTDPLVCFPSTDALAIIESCHLGGAAKRE